MVTRILPAVLLFPAASLITHGSSIPVGSLPLISAMIFAAVSAHRREAFSLGRIADTPPSLFLSFFPKQDQHRRDAIHSVHPEITHKNPGMNPGSPGLFTPHLNTGPKQSASD